MRMGGRVIIKMVNGVNGAKGAIFYFVLSQRGKERG